ncbi:MAG: hypothetical protein ACYDGW_10175 [Vulcanimicrobiaceae bacterium]
MTATAEVQPLFSPLPLHRQLMWWTVAFPVVMIVALVERSFYLLNWIHVLSGALWTGADLFMGFVLGPVLRSLDMRARTAVIAYLVPRTLLYFPMVSLTTGTAGWLLASWLGFLVPGHAQFSWAIAALALVTVMTIQGLGVMLPNSLRIWSELRRPEPDRERIVRLNRTNIVLAGVQGVMQVVIIVVMAHFVVG